VKILQKVFLGATFLTHAVEAMPRERERERERESGLATLCRPLSAIQHRISDDM